MMQVSREFVELKEMYLPEDFDLSKTVKRMRRRMLADVADLDDLIVQWTVEEKVNEDISVVLGLSRVVNLDAFLLWLRTFGEMNDMACWFERHYQPEAEHDA